MVGRLVSATPEARLACIGLPAPRFNSSFVNAQFQPAYPGASETKACSVLADHACLRLRALPVWICASCGKERR